MPTYYIKGGFFSESAIRFSDLQISKKKYSKKLSWAWNTRLNLNFKLRIVFLEYFFFEIGMWKNFIALSEKKPPLVWIKRLLNIKLNVQGYTKSVVRYCFKSNFLQPNHDQSHIIPVYYSCKIESIVLCSFTLHAIKFLFCLCLLERKSKKKIR